MIAAQSRSGNSREQRLTGEQRYQLFRDNNLSVRLLTDDRSVKEAIAYIEELNPTVLAVDYETARKRNSYGALNGTIRLIQLGVHEPQRGIENQQFIIDCHRADPAPVKRLFKNSEIEKQVHYLDFETEWTLTHLGCNFNNLYDTCAAWAVIQKELREMAPEERERVMPGWEKHNNKLVTIAEKTLGISIPKEEQGGYWERADLTADQIIYAAMDVAILPEITRRTKEAAERVGASDKVASRIDWLQGKVAARVKAKSPEELDDSLRVSETLERASSVEQLDRLWLVSHQVPVAAKNRGRLRQFYRKRRRELKSA